MKLDDLHRIRGHEVRRVLELLPPQLRRGRMLEIGAGSGFQAQMFAKAGYRVEAIDVKDWNPGDPGGFPVRIYDGRTIPFPDRSFDVVFSSNVLEHIPHLEEFQAEMQRVLQPRGIAVHVLPSGSWRIWTNLFHYLHLPGVVLAGIRRRVRPPRPAAAPPPPRHTTPADDAAPPGLAGRMRALALPSRHGERGNVFSEVFYFSRFYWSRLFRKAGWRILQRRGSGIFYEGYMILPRFFSIGALSVLSRLAGGSTHIYLLAAGPAVEGNGNPATAQSAAPLE